MKIIISSILGFALLFFAYVAYADPGHHTTPYTPTETITEKTTINYYTEKTAGIALNLASQHHYDYSSNQLQGSVGLGEFDGKTGLSIGLAKKLCNGCLLSGSLGVEEGKVGAGLSYGFKF